MLGCSSCGAAAATDNPAAAATAGPVPGSWQHRPAANHTDHPDKSGNISLPITSNCHRIVTHVPQSTAGVVDLM